ncbi:MAG: inositol monophosphatase family protein [Candidatus Fervidibacter sp.]|uniref:inositol monophosphatase family protein n=1 Tax=Candidatus Fervidibacter sp. TaxID=3100871 RepID=UPI004049F389
MERGDLTLTEFVVHTVAGAIQNAQRLGETATDVVEVRGAGYREWDPEVIRIDKELEKHYVQALKGTSRSFIVLSEELQREELQGKGELVYAVCDPFDGSALYRRRIKAFWFTALAVYDLQGIPLGAAVGDILAGKVEFFTPQGSFVAHIDNLEHRRPLRPNGTKELREAYLATYLMKPHFLYPTVERYKGLLSAVKFVLPNGGPCGFTDVASGRCDVYLAVQQPMIEIFAGLPIALGAGCVVTDFNGNPVTFAPDINRRYDVVCSCTEELHHQVLTVLKGSK